MRTLLKAAIATFTLDQVIKYVVLFVLNLDQVRQIDVLPPFLRLVMAWNEGVNFGFLSGSTDLARWALILLALAISAWIWGMARREPRNQKVQISAGLLIGGALGNVLDRLLYGAVADFLNMSVPGIYNPFSFNLADVAIFFGALGLVFFSARDKTP